MRNAGRQLRASSFFVVLFVVAGIADLVSGQPAQPTALGKLVRCEPVSRSITLQTRSGTVTFVLAEDAVLREGVKNIEFERVATLIGRTAKVRYHAVGGRRIVRQLTVAAATPRHDSGAARAPRPDEPR